MEAALLGRDKTFPLREDWEEIKEKAMRRALHAKFSNNEDIRDILLSTYPQKIVESTSDDYYWGCGTDGTGLNKLGCLLMELREEFIQQ